MAWKVGRKVGRTLYDGDELIGLMDTRELAARVVAAVNSEEVFLRELAQHVVDYFGEGELTPSADGCSELRDRARELLGLRKLTV